ncbi:MAG: glutathione S-transferase N-terminal domain-containing protein [Candidatus Poseidoniaceae archaeon]
MSQSPSLHMLQTCPFCWKVSGMTDYLKIDVNQVQVNAMKTKKELAFAGDWGKVPVWTSGAGEVVVDSTPILKFIDKEHFDGKISARGDEEKNEQWLEWADTKLSKATVPILYGTLGSAFKTTIRVARLEKFGFISRRLYAWAGFPIMWGFVARKHIKNDDRTPKKLWHDLLDEFTAEFENSTFFAGDEPGIVDFAAYGYMKSISPFPQFAQLTDHAEGMKWYNSMEKATS